MLAGKQYLARVVLVKDTRAAKKEMAVGYVFC